MWRRSQRALDKSLMVSLAFYGQGDDDLGEIIALDGEEVLGTTAS
jgi:hypothetical protein